MSPLDRSDLHQLGMRLGERRILEILNRFYQKLSSDVLVGFFFEGKDLDAIAQKQADFFSRAAQLKTTYNGKSPGTAHLSLAPILTGHFDRRLRVLESTLAAEGMAAEDIRTWIDFEETFRSAVTAHTEASRPQGN
jgi:truncated hemoglobin YjbI